MHAHAQPFFLATSHGERYCLFHAPAGTCRGALVYVHPFAEEMNKSRRMAAQQARALARMGYGVLQVDLQGCGDSDGDFGDARWDHWKEDVAVGSAWLQARLGVPVGLWGLRLGALLALDYARDARQPVAQLLLWQPVLQGAAFLTQFLRLRVAGGMLDQADTAGAGTKGLRAALQAGETLEIAGYRLSPQLAAAIDAADATRLAPSSPVCWIERVAAPDLPLPPAAVRVAETWAAQGNTPRIQAVPFPPFWSTQEIAEYPPLIEASCALLEAGHG